MKPAYIVASVLIPVAFLGIGVSVYLNNNSTKIDILGNLKIDFKDGSYVTH